MTLYCNGQSYAYGTDEDWLVHDPIDHEWLMPANLKAVADAVWEGQE